MTFSKSDAKKQVVKARRLCGEEDYDSEESALNGEVDDSAAATDAKARQTRTSLDGQKGSSFDHQGLHPSRRLHLAISAENKSRRSRKRKSQTGNGSDIAPNSKRKANSESTCTTSETFSASNKGRRQRANKGSRSEDHDLQAKAGDGVVSAHPDAPKAQDRPNVGRKVEVKSTQTKASTERTNGNLENAHSDRRKSDEKTSSPLLSVTHQEGFPKDLKPSKKRLRKRQLRKEKRLARKSTDQTVSLTDVKAADEMTSSANDSIGPQDRTRSIEPKSQAEAHENFVRSTQRDPNGQVPYGTKDKEAKNQSQEATAAFDVELRALNAYSNEKQIDSLDKGLLGGETKAVKDNIKEMKAEREKLEEDERAGKRKIEAKVEDLEARKSNKATEALLDPSEPRPKKRRKKYKASADSDVEDVDFRTPMIL